MSSNRETRELYAHLTVPTDDQLARDIVKIVADALDDVRREPKLWSDFERQAVRTLAISLRAHIEGLFEDFYFGSEAKRTRAMARMCSDVGSLWRVDWTEIAERLFEDGGHILEPPEQTLLGGTPGGRQRSSIMQDVVAWWPSRGLEQFARSIEWCELPLRIRLALLHLDRAETEARTAEHR